jgi:protein-disulfide isomerase
MWEMRRQRLLLLAIAVALVAAGLVIALVRTGGGSNAHRATPSQVSRLFAGIPQSRLVVGSPKAPVTLVEFADLQCPYCGDWARVTLPTIVRKYVRTGKVKIEFRGLHFIGPDSEKALRAVLAAGLQNRLWQVVESLYQRQGRENSGWVTDELLRTVGGKLPGLDTGKMLAQRDDPWVTKQLDEATQLATAIGVNSTPTFYAGKKGGKLQLVQLGSLNPSGIEPTLDKLLAG